MICKNEKLICQMACFSVADPPCLSPSVTGQHSGHPGVWGRHPCNWQRAESFLKKRKHKIPNQLWTQVEVWDFTLKEEYYRTDTTSNCKNICEHKIGSDILKAHSRAWEHSMQFVFGDKKEQRLRSRRGIIRWFEIDRKEEASWYQQWDLSENLGTSSEKCSCMRD